MKITDPQKLQLLKERNNRWKVLYAGGMTMQQIAKVYNVNSSTVGKAISFQKYE